MPSSNKQLHHLAADFDRHLQLEQNVNLRVIQTLLGHVKLDITALYTQIATNTIRAVTSPLDRLTPLNRTQTPPP